jgi:hypothetical protein
MPIWSGCSTAQSHGSVPQRSVCEPCERDKVCRRKNWNGASLLENHEGVDGQDIEHILVNGFLIAYWLDHPVCLVMFVDVEDVR